MRTPTTGCPGRATRAPRAARPLAARLRPALGGAALAAGLAACEGTTSLLAPGEGQLAATTGAAVTVGGLAAEALLGRWTRVDGTVPGVLVETTFTFFGSGTGSRNLVTRTVLGAVLSEDRQAFTWTAGAGVLLLRLPGPLGDTLVRASFVVESELTGTTLVLDGIPYRRAAG